MLRLCQRLVQIPSVNGVHPEQAVADAIVEALEERGTPVHTWSFAPERPCLLGSIGSGEEGVLFVGHMDTVAIGEPAHWTVDPFGGEVRGGRLYGRGACDNKAGIAVAITLLGYLRDYEEVLRGPVLLA
ncbi:MAG: M20/M25/M40 family metallo-hydrolase, partial [Geodermatophilaceae bacterium]|nr:M20/M25/M40 family metallo-hydrolase [Geodermatophilaceae bacterium]